MCACSGCLGCVAARHHGRLLMGERRCKDCASLDIQTSRPAPHPGPRCTTHHRERKRETKARNHERRVQTVYKLPPGMYAKLYEAQGGKCAICVKATGASRALSVDHDHACCGGAESCGLCVRGLICRPCNDMLGRAGDDPAMFGRAIVYLEDPPARKVLKP